MKLYNPSMESADGPVTRQDLEQLKQEILDGVQEIVRDSQTGILKAFFPSRTA